MLTPESGRMTVPLDAADVAADVLIGLRQAGLEITSVSVDQPTLDEVFLAITGHDAGQAEESEEVLPEEAVLEVSLT